MADRVSSRRNLTNTFFLTLNTALTATAASTLPKASVSVPWLALATMALLTECALWFTMVRSYRLLNSAKFSIITEMEKRLPAAPWSAEWKALGPGHGVRRYWRLTLLERWIPAIFAGFYLIALLALLAR
ncbi:RipA family octameric membrane protein [Micromonospora echinofusca]|uniref:RipA family octameric membrane protein n=1 Tax=Micromonospora echinofusca TaxID=47858 RepID=UPI003F4DC026